LPFPTREQIGVREARLRPTGFPRPGNVWDIFDFEEYDRWQLAAGQALEGAGLQAAGGLFHWAAFQSEQAAQLTLKGLLHGIGQGPEAWGHDVNRLGTRVAAALGEQLEPGLAGALQRLARHYIVARYPDAVPGDAPSAYYSQADADSAKDDASAVLGAVAAWWASLLRAQGPGAAQETTGDEER
jgi:HEPN domain-containing protein